MNDEDKEKTPVHYMVDIETLGTQPGAAILSIGTVCFFPKQRQILAEQYLRIKPTGELDAGAIAFWLKQEEPARLEMVKCIEEGLSLKHALHQFSHFILDDGMDGTLARKQVRLWGNGATFDNVLLDAAFARTGQQVPWRYSGHRCFRTLVSLCGERLAVAREGVHHNGLDDAKYQVKVLFAAMDKLGLEDLY